MTALTGRVPANSGSSSNSRWRAVGVVALLLFTSGLAPLVSAQSTSGAIQRPKTPPTPAAAPASAPVAAPAPAVPAAAVAAPKPVSVTPKPLAPATAGGAAPAMVLPSSLPPTVVPGVAAPAAGPLIEVLPPGQLRDCADCPVMVTLPAGEFRYGSAPEAREAEPGTGETPARVVTLSRSFLLSRTEVTVAQFRAFAKATQHTVEPRCQAFAGGWVVEDGMDWQSAGEATLATASADLPVTCVSWDDARAYVEWLSTTTGQKYRLPSELEWEYAARGGSSGARSFATRDAVAESWDATLCDNANVFDQDAIDAYPPRLLGRWQAHCRDGVVGLATSGRFPPNAFDLVDLLGNAREWVQDCQTTSRSGAPLDGRAWEWSGCTLRGVRGGSFLTPPAAARSAARERAVPSLRAFDLGFRVARDTAKP